MDDMIASQAACDHLTDKTRTVLNPVEILSLVKGLTMGHRCHILSITREILVVYQRPHGFAAQRRQQCMVIPKVQHKDGQIVFHAQRNRCAIHHRQATA